MPILGVIAISFAVTIFSNFAVGLGISKEVDKRIDERVEELKKEGKLRDTGIPVKKDGTFE